MATTSSEKPQSTNHVPNTRTGAGERMPAVREDRDRSGRLIGWQVDRRYGDR